MPELRPMTTDRHEGQATGTYLISDVDELNLALLGIAYPGFRFQLLRERAAVALGRCAPGCTRRGDTRDGEC